MLSVWQKHSFLPQVLIDHKEKDELQKLALKKPLDQIENFRSTKYVDRMYDVDTPISEIERIFFWTSILLARVRAEMGDDYISYDLHQLKTHLEICLKRSCVVSYTSLVLLNWIGDDQGSVFFTFTDHPGERDLYKKCLIFEHIAANIIYNITKLIQENWDYDKIGKENFKKVFHFCEIYLKKLWSELLSQRKTCDQIEFEKGESYLKWKRYWQPRPEKWETIHSKQEEQEEAHFYKQSPSFCFFQYLYHFFTASLAKDTVLLIHPSWPYEHRSFLQTLGVPLTSWGTFHSTYYGSANSIIDLSKRIIDYCPNVLSNQYVDLKNVSLPLDIQSMINQAKKNSTQDAFRMMKPLSDTNHSKPKKKDFSFPILYSCIFITSIGIFYYYIKFH